MGKAEGEVICPCCDRLQENFLAFHKIAVLGMTCEDCFRKLRDPILLDGVVQSEPLAEIAAKMQAEFDGRTERLIRMARGIVSGK